MGLEQVSGEGRFQQAQGSPQPQQSQATLTRLPSRGLEACCSERRPPQSRTSGKSGQTCPLFFSDIPFLPPRQMPSGMGTEDSGEVTPGAPQPTRIDVHFHQESALAKLILKGCPLLRPPVPGTTFQARGSSRLLVASWVSRGAEEHLGP